MKTLVKHQNKSVSRNNLVESISLEIHLTKKQLNASQERLEALQNAAKALGGVKTRQKVVATKNSRRPRHTGAPNELFEALKSVNGEFTVDRAVVAVKEAKSNLDRTQILNSIQFLIKKGKVRVVKAGLGRSHAVYALKTPKAKTVE